MDVGLNAKGREAAESSVDRYLRAERAFWGHYGLASTERFVEVGSPPLRLRLQEVGSGQPILFVHGTGGPGAYFAPLVRELGGFRCLLLDRPGWGLSSPIDYSGTTYGTLIATLLRETLDALGIERAHVVGGSIGNLWALRLAQAFPQRVGRIVLMGGGPLTAEIQVPTFIRLLRSALGWLIVRIPEKPGMLRKQLAALGHSASLEAGRIPDAFIEWHLAMSRETGRARHERDMVRSIVTRRGFVEGLVLKDSEIAGIEHPTLMIYGTADGAGSVDTWRRFVNRMTRAELETVDKGGHLVWYDDPTHIGDRVRTFLEE
jgi:pimeloyl-ACP methyl ester carboxylesterase